MLLHPGRQVCANATSPVFGIDCGVAPVSTRELGVGNQTVPVEDPDRVGADVKAGALPITDDVGLLDDDFAEVKQLSGGYDGGNRRLVAECQDALCQARWECHTGIEAEHPGLARTN